MSLFLTPSDKPVRMVSSLSEFINERDVALALGFLQESEVPLPEIITFSNEDAEYLKVFPKVYFPEVHPGYTTPNWTCVRRESNKFLLLEDGADGMIFDHSGKVTNSTGPLFRASYRGVVVSQDGKSALPKEIISNAVSIDEPIVVFFDEHLQNYYHWWIECMVRLNLTSNILQLPFRAISSRKRSDLRNWQRDSLDLIGGDKVIYPSSPVPLVVAVPEIIWCDRYTISHAPAFLFRSLASRVREQIGKLHTNERSIPGIFIKRATSRQVENTEEVERVLRELGIEALVLDDFDQIEEIKIFMRCEIIIGVLGSGLTNILFARPGTRVLELMSPNEIRDHFWVLSSKLNLKFGAIICKANGRNIDSNLVVDVEQLRRATEEMLAM